VKFIEVNVRSLLEMIGQRLRDGFGCLARREKAGAIEQDTLT